MTLTIPFKPRRGDGIPQVVGLGRISRSTQDMDSIDSQHVDADVWLKREHPEPHVVRCLGEQASGWIPDRETMLETKRLIETYLCDVFLVTEVREAYRNPAFQWGFVQYCVENDVRFISIADCVDTADENWEIMMHTAALRHGMTVPEVRRRGRRMATYAFSRGGMVLKVKFGYRKLSKEEAASGQFGPVGLRIMKLSEHTETLREIKARVIRGDRYGDIVDWLTAAGVPCGPYVTSRKWTVKLLVALLKSPVLSGSRSFRDIICQPVYSTGKLRRRPNENPERTEYPELAHFSKEEHAELLAAMKARRKGDNPPHKGPEHPRYNQPRSRSLLRRG